MNKTKELEEIDRSDIARMKGKKKRDIETAMRLATEDTLEEVKETIFLWWNDEKTCSGKPSCKIDECDLCYNCFDDLIKRIEKLGEK